MARKRKGYKGLGPQSKARLTRTVELAPEKMVAAGALASTLREERKKEEEALPFWKRLDREFSD